MTFGYTSLFISNMRETAMLDILVLAAILDDVSPEHARALALVVEKQNKSNRYKVEPYVKAQATADLNGDNLIDAVVVYAYKVSVDLHGQLQYLSVVVSSPTGYVASWPVHVGARGYRDFREIQIEGTRITLRGDFTVADETASMARLPAAGEIYYTFKDGKLREQGGKWTRKPDQ
jgi:hypothetical protein